MLLVWLMEPKSYSMDVLCITSSQRLLYTLEHWVGWIFRDWCTTISVMQTIIFSPSLHWSPLPSDFTFWVTLVEEISLKDFPACLFPSDQLDSHICSNWEDCLQSDLMPLSLQWDRCPVKSLLPSKFCHEFRYKFHNLQQSKWNLSLFSLSSAEGSHPIFFPY